MAVITRTLPSFSCIDQQTTASAYCRKTNICRNLLTSWDWVWDGITTVTEVSCLIPLLPMCSSYGETNYCQPTRKLPTGTGCILAWTIVRDLPNGSTWTLNKGCLIMKLNVKQGFFLLWMKLLLVSLRMVNSLVTLVYASNLISVCHVHWGCAEHSVGVTVNEWSLCVNERNTCMLTYYSVRDVNRYDFQQFVSLKLNILFWGEPLYD